MEPQRYVDPQVIISSDVISPSESESIRLHWLASKHIPILKRRALLGPNKLKTCPSNSGSCFQVSSLSLTVNQAEFLNQPAPTPLQNQYLSPSSQLVNHPTSVQIPHHNNSVSSLAQPSSLNSPSLLCLRQHTLTSPLLFTFV